jgi:hypothetical protein
VAVVGERIVASRGISTAGGAVTTADNDDQ